MPVESNGQHAPALGAKKKSTTDCSVKSAMLTVQITSTHCPPDFPPNQVWPRKPASLNCFTSSPMRYQGHSSRDVSYLHCSSHNVPCQGNRSLDSLVQLLMRELRLDVKFLSSAACPCLRFCFHYCCGIHHPWRAALPATARLAACATCKVFRKAVRCASLACVQRTLDFRAAQAGWGGGSQSRCRLSNLQLLHGSASPRPRQLVRLHLVPSLGFGTRDIVDGKVIRTEPFCPKLCHGNSSHTCHQQALLCKPTNYNNPSTVNDALQPCRPGEVSRIEHCEATGILSPLRPMRRTMASQTSESIACASSEL